MNSNISPSLKKQHQQAKQTVDRFVRRFEPSYRQLVRHAALPLVLTPELLNYLRNQFLRSEELQVPWVAEVDLLLSDLCKPVGYEQYAMDIDVRAYLLAEMQQDESGVKQMQEVARLLIAYLKHLSLSDPYIRQNELQAQQWSAMVYLDDQRDEAVSQIAHAFQEVANSSLINRDEIARLSGITQELQEQLKREPEKYQDFLEYANSVSKLIAGESINEENLNRSYSVSGIALQVPTQLVPGRNSDSNTILTFETFEFDVATIEVKAPKGRSKKSEPIINRTRHQAQYFTENLPDNISLEMVSIPGGAFMMGSPETEEKSLDWERPQHEVTVQPFFMGKYTITQAQWRVVAGMEQVNRQLNPDPSRFKGDNLPVESISWDDAVEFCDRISKYTEKNYRLPSEAEWEYACRGGTTTAFHFGETITSELANYDGTTVYGSGTEGEYRETTTPVGSFGVANVFGLYDMHGNVWEWCLDDWHENYDGAPTDGSPWLGQKDNDNDNRFQLLRGGSWINVPEDCRSAFRYYGNYIYNYFGFRVVVVAGARIL
jgi:formylglycine-generating enzyme required for sulfatase activity